MASLDEEILMLERLAAEEDEKLQRASQSKLHKEQELRAKDGLLQQRVAEVAKLRSAASSLQRQVEEEEEFISNGLIKKLGVLQKEKEQLAREVELEEEFLMNSLQRELVMVGKEKAELERHLKKERKFMVNKLEKQLNASAELNKSLQKILEINKADDNDLLKHLTAYKETVKQERDDGHGSDSDSTSFSSSTHQTLSVQHLHESASKRMQNEILRLQSSCSTKEGEVVQNAENCDELRGQLEQMLQSNFLQDLKNHRLREEYHKASGERNRLLLNTEVLLEHDTNTSKKPPQQRRASSSSSSLNGLRAHTEQILSAQCSVTPPTTPHLSPMSTSGASTPRSRTRTPYLTDSFNKMPSLSPVKPT